MGRVKDWGTRKDDNHKDVAGWFRALMCRVKEVHMVPGFVDLVVKCGGTVAFVEIKDPGKKPSARRLTQAEQDFWEYWGEDPVIVETQEDVFNLVDRLRKSGL